MPKPIRMADIADKLGVSVVTVSKALSNKSGVSDEVREKIFSLASEMGYKVSGKSFRTTGNIGMLVPAKFLDANAFYWELYQRVLEHLRAENCYGILEILSPEDEQSPDLPQMLIDKKVDGIITFGQVTEQCLSKLYATEIPLMFLDSYRGVAGRSCVISDNYYGMYSLVNYLMRMGHRDIHFVGSIGATNSISDRFFGYCRAMSDQMLTVDNGMVLQDRDADGNLGVNLPDVLPTAYACNCDLTAYMVIMALAERGLRVPDDVSVVGFDDFLRIPNNPGFPALTTYAVNMDAMAAASVKGILRKLSDSEYRPALKTVAGRLVIRDSVREINDK